MKTSLQVCVGICALAAPVTLALAESVASAPIPEPAPTISYLVPVEDLLLPGADRQAKGALAVVVVTVEGTASVTPIPGSAESIALEEGMILGPGARILTGMGEVALKIGEAQLYVVGAMADVMIDTAERDGGKDTTVVFIETGSVSFDITSTEFANDVQLKAPDATLAVKGTNGSMQVRGGFPTRAWGGRFNQGEINVSYWTGRIAVFRDDSRTDAANADPLSNAIARTAINTGATEEREPDEDDAVARTPGGSQAVGRLVRAGADQFTADSIIEGFMFDDPPAPGGGGSGGGNGGGNPSNPDPGPPPTSNFPPPSINPQPPTTPTIDPPAPAPIVPPAFDDDAPPAPSAPSTPAPDFGSGPSHPGPTIVPSNNASMPIGAPAFQAPDINADVMRRIERIACRSADHAACRAAIARDSARVKSLLDRGFSPERAVRTIDACTCAAKAATKKKAGRR